VGSVTEVTTDDLSAEDSDTPPEGLEFIVTPPSNGYLALKSAPSRHILNFTQNHIQSRQLVFVHSGTYMLLFVVSFSKGLSKEHLCNDYSLLSLTQGPYRVVSTFK